ncbi:MAG: hypothetical protein LBR10_11340 [Prevotellaceae bacterium]|jgi:hypothetical protein|nr:hypothetical protein [Prevotellaceae bacterium]
MDLIFDVALSTINIIKNKMNKLIKEQETLTEIKTEVEQFNETKPRLGKFPKAPKGTRPP